MTTIEDIYKKNRNKLLREDEDIDAFVFSFVERLSKEECLNMIKDLSEEEVQSLLVIVLTTHLKNKLSNDDQFFIGESPFLH
ncbi:MAG: DUF6154 family protein [Bacillaceae bacterium]|nr:DUF6154 family protein [Bacillaceae bacterium]